jgi:hypothetical protein
MITIPPSEVLAIKDVDQLRKLILRDLEGRDITREEFFHVFGLCDAIWYHSGDPREPHVVLDSGLCSNGYVSCPKVLQYLEFCDLFAYQAAREYRKQVAEAPQWVVGSAYAALDFSNSVARQFGAIHGHTEKVVVKLDGGGEREEQRLKRFEIPEGMLVLDAEELMSTSGTAEKVHVGIEQGNPHPVRFAPLLVLVHRSPVTEFRGRPIIYPPQFHLDIWTAKPEECSLCQNGSERIDNVKDTANWQRLLSWSKAA